MVPLLHLNSNPNPDPTLTPTVQWRHCPYGLHQFVPQERPYFYLTLLRAPVQRSVSWYCFFQMRKCDRSQEKIVAWHEER